MRRGSFLQRMYDVLINGDESPSLQLAINRVSQRSGGTVATYGHKGRLRNLYALIVLKWGKVKLEKQQ